MCRIIGTLAAVVMMAAGARAARAQDAAAMAMQASQQSMQMAQQASQQAIDAMNMASQQAQMSMQMAMNNDSYMPMPRPALPMTLRPMISPGGGSFKGGVSVVLYDADPRAIVFYTTDGSLPTPGSQRYAGPIVVGSKLKVRAMAFDLEEMPSGVVSKTFRVKS
jgi:hypothetical protein